MLPRALPLSFAAALCLIPSTARADLLTVTAGTAIVNPFGAPTMLADLSGENFSLSFAWREFPVECRGFCAVGDVVTLTTTLTSLFVNTPPGQNQAVSGPLAFTGILTFDGPAFVLPPIPQMDPTAPNFVAEFSGPFTLSGTLSTWRAADVFEPQLLSTNQLTGIGTVTGRYAAVGTGGYRIIDTRYEFAPIPEPGTLLLVGTGLAAARACRRRRG